MIFSIIEKFLKTINDNATLPNYKRTIFHKLMKSMNFKYERKGCKKKNIRPNYLKKLKQFRETKRQIYYLDKT